MFKKAAVWLSVLLVALALTACADTIAEKAIESQSGGKVKVNKRGNSVELKTKEGTVRVGETKLPDGFPKDVPVYKRAKIRGSLDSSGKGGQNYLVTLSSTDGFDKVADYYKQAMPKNGWKELSKFEGGEGSSRVATYGYEKDKRQATIGVTSSDSGKKAEITLSVNSNPSGTK